MLKLPRLGMILHSRLSHLATLLLGGTSVCSLMVHLSGGSAWNREQDASKAAGRTNRLALAGTYSDAQKFVQDTDQHLLESITNSQKKQLYSMRFDSNQILERVNILRLAYTLNEFWRVAIGDRFSIVDVACSVQWRISQARFRTPDQVSTMRKNHLFSPLL